MSESQLIEYKESWRDEYLKWICGFANAQGGVLYIGKRDDGSVCGVADSKKLMEDIPNKVRDALGLIVDVDLITENGLDVIKINVEENPYPVNYKGEYHYRTGSTKQLLQGSALTKFLLRKTGKNWDAVPLENVNVDDLDKESFDIFHREAIRSGRMSKDDLKLSNQDLLEKLNLLDGTMLNRAAVLIFQKSMFQNRNLQNVENLLFRLLMLILNNSEEHSKVKQKEEISRFQNGLIKWQQKQKSMFLQ